jgi:predicted nucleic acid-binding protein
MTEKVFLDTNILLYADVNDGSEKFLCASKLLKHDLRRAEVFISTQVIGEFYVNSLRKGIDCQIAQNTINEFIDDFTIVSITTSLVSKAFRILNRYQFSYWDSLIIAAALEGGCTVLYSEDLQDGQVIEKTLVVKNPFAVKKY